MRHTECVDDEFVESIDRKLFEDRGSVRVLEKVVRNSDKPLLIVNPNGGDIYSFFGVPQNPEVYPILKDVQKRTQIVGSITDIDTQYPYALVISGVFGFEVNEQSTQHEDYVTDLALKCFSAMNDKDVPVLVLTSCSTLRVIEQLLKLPNLLYLGQKPFDEQAISYILDCYAKGKVLHVPIAHEWERSPFSDFPGRYEKPSWINEEGYLSCNCCKW